MKTLMNKAILLAALGLAACDETTTITHVDRLPDFVLSELWKIQDDRGNLAAMSSRSAG